MTQTSPIPVDDQNVIDFSEHPGRRLRVQRQTRGLEIERVATQLHLKREILEALEQDRYDVLPDPVFVAGYLRNYARLLGLDPRPLVAAYRNAAQHADAWKVPGRGRESVRAEPDANHHGSGGLVALVLLLAALGAVALWRYDSAAPELPNLSEMMRGWFQPVIEAPSEILDTAEVPIDPALSDESRPPRLILPAAIQTAEPASDTEPEARRIAADPPSDPQPLVTNAEAAPASETDAEAEADRFSANAGDLTAAPAAAAPPEVALEFERATWIEVRDADRRVILTGTMRGGDRRALTGARPLSFIVGNASSTRMTVGGQPFDLTAHARGNVARFTLDAETPMDTETPE